MRPIGQLETEEQARTLADYLFVRDIETQVEPAKAGTWTVWVVDEERVDEGQALLSRFRSMPDAEEFYQASAVAERRRQEEQQETRAAEKKLKRSGAIPWLMAGGGFTTVLLVLSVAAALASQLGAGAWTGILMISMDRVAQGEVWRLITPIFLHFGPWHLVFNLLWMQDLGRTLEGRIGTWGFAGVVVLVALASNLAQYAVGGPGFGGLSGVVYGVFGYLWVRGRLDFRFGVFLAPMTSGLLMIYLALGVFGLLGPTANAAHFSGLAAGAVLGWWGVRRS